MFSSNLDLEFAAIITTAKIQWFNYGQQTSDYAPKFIEVYLNAAQFVLLYYLRPLLPNSSHHLCIWNNTFHSDMACRRVVVGKRMKSLIYWKKIKIIFFFRGKRVFLIRNCVRKPKKMVPMLYDEDFGFKLAFFDDPGK